MNSLINSSSLDLKTCTCVAHTLYTYKVVANKGEKFHEYNDWEYSGVHSCRIGRCSGDFHDRHYMGSSTSEIYQNIKKESPDILKLVFFEEYGTCASLDEAEQNLVNHEYIKRANTFNVTLGGGRGLSLNNLKCVECLGSLSSHRKNCSLYRFPNPCENCHAIKGHYKECKFFFRKNCVECEGVNGGHYKTCSKYTQRTLCELCNGQSGQHRKNCSSYIPIRQCNECTAPITSHKKYCSMWFRKQCMECQSIGSHVKECTYYTKNPCGECGTLGVRHFKSCSKYFHGPYCDECKSKSSSRHRKNCSKYVTPTKCYECGSKARHRRGCSKYYSKQSCEECGSIGYMHRKQCSQFKFVRKAIK